MWKNIYQKLNVYHQTLSIKDYCDAFLKLVNPNDKVWSLEDVENYLSINTASDLFPETRNLHDYFNYGDYRFVANYVYHFPQTNKWWFDTDGNWENWDADTQYKKIFDETSDIYLLKKAIFMPEFLLSEDLESRQLTYLFLFFLPIIENYGMLYHHIKKIPLLCCHGITDENFNMLLHLMKEYDAFGINILSKERNLNHILIEDFMENAKELYSFDPDTDWDKVLPLYKIYQLIDINCSFKSFSEKIDPKFLYMFEHMPQMLLEIERRYLYSKLDNQLQKKQPLIKEAVIKI
jgi:hypothetical protein